MLGATADATRHQRLDRVPRDTEAGRDLLLRARVDIAEKKYLTTTLRQRADGLGEERPFLTATDQIDPSGRAIQNGQRVDFPAGNFAVGKFFAGGSAHRVARNGEQQRLHATDGPVLPRPEESQVGLLQQIIGIDRGGSSEVQLRGAELRAVALRLETNAHLRGFGVASREGGVTSRLIVYSFGKNNRFAGAVS
jgi:hypothetical protein